MSNKVYPNTIIYKYGLGEDVGWVEIQNGVVKLFVDFGDAFEEGRVISTDLAPLFRMIANRLDEASGKRGRRGK